MQIEPQKRTMKNPPEQFAGDVWLDPIALPHTEDQRMTVATVRFAPGARTAWHLHARGQYLRVTAGVARGDRDGNVYDAHPGQTIYTPPGEEHFHAAAGDSFMEHLAMIEAADDPSTGVRTDAMPALSDRSIHAVIDSTYPFVDAGLALDRLRSGKAEGKIVITVD